jgi:hypothetical protein
MDKVDKTTATYGHVEMDDSSTIIEQELQGDNITHIQTNTQMEGGSVYIIEQTIVQGG